MGVNSLSKTVTRQRRGCDLNPGPSAPEYSTLTTRLPSHRGLDKYPRPTAKYTATYNIGTIKRTLKRIYSRPIARGHELAMQPGL